MGQGLLYAAMLGGYLGPFKPGQRAASHISPMILTEDNEPYMGIGAAGGSRINSAIIQAISRVLDRGRDLAKAPLRGLMINSKKLNEVFKTCKRPVKLKRIT